MTISNNIRTFRLQKRLSQEKLGELLGVSAQAVSKWEQGITSPDISLLPIMAECFGVTIDSLFQGTHTRKYPGYTNERDELKAIYESPSGTEEDFRRAAEAYSEVILNGNATTEDYISYGILHKVRAFRDIKIALHYYASALQMAGSLEEAWREVEQALKLAPENGNVHNLAGDLCARLGRYQEAVIHWDKAFEKEPASISCLFSKAEMFASIGENDKAVAQFEEILSWLEDRGYNMELEGVYPRKRIAELWKG